MLICAAGDIHGAMDRLYQDVLAFEAKLNGLRTHAAWIDTKYKASEKPSLDDLSQMALYSLQTGTRKAFLVYPSNQNTPFKARIGDVSIKSLTFDIGTAPRPDGDSFLRTFLEQLF